MTAQGPSPGLDASRADWISCFGYGSLVNRRTLPGNAELVPISVSGYRRAWRLSGLAKFGRRCTLNVVRDASCSILGMAIRYPLLEVPELDRREAHYDRIALPPESVDWVNGRPDGWPDPFVFVGKREFATPGDEQHPIYLSYVDTVLAGYIAEFGEAGAKHFMETTLDWHIPIVDDRDAPAYPRATPPDREERMLIDDTLRSFPITLIEKEPSD